MSGGSDRNQYFVSGEYNKELGPYKMPQAEINRLQTERGAARPVQSDLPERRRAREPPREPVDAARIEGGLQRLDAATSQRADRQPQNEDNSTGLMVDALGGTRAHRPHQNRRAAACRSTGTAATRWATSSRRSDRSDVNRFTNSLNARYYPFSWLNDARQPRLRLSRMRTSSTLIRFDQGPFGETTRQGAITDTRTENAQYTVDVGATGDVQSASQHHVEDVGRHAVLPHLHRLSRGLAAEPARRAPRR